MNRFRPSAISTVALVAVGWGLCSLGFWQVDRWRVMSEQKRAFDQEIEKPPVQVQGLRQLDTVAPWRRVELVGRYVGSQGRVINKYIDRQPGVWLAAPFRLKDGTHIVVMRGWVPETESDVEPPKGEQTVVGMLRDGSGDLGAHLDGDEFRSLDGYATLAQYDLKNAVGRIVIEGALVPHGQAFPKALPRRGFYGFVIRRPHREYAGTWFGLAFALFAIWVYAGVRRARLQEAT